MINNGFPKVFRLYLRKDERKKERQIIHVPIKYKCNSNRFLHTKKGILFLIRFEKLNKIYGTSFFERVPSKLSVLLMIKADKL